MTRGIHRQPATTYSKIRTDKSTTKHQTTRALCLYYPLTSIKASLFRPRESLRHIPSATDASNVDMIMFTCVADDA